MGHTQYFLNIIFPEIRLMLPLLHLLLLHVISVVNIHLVFELRVLLGWAFYPRIFRFLFLFIYVLNDILSLQLLRKADYGITSSVEHWYSPVLLFICLLSIRLLRLLGIKGRHISLGHQVISLFPLKISRSLTKSRIRELYLLQIPINFNMRRR